MSALREQRKRSARIASSSIAGNARDRASECARTGTRKQLYHPSFNFLSAYRVHTDMGYGAKRIRRVHDDACRSPIFVFENFVDSDTRSARDSPALRRVSRSFLSLRVPPGDDAPRFSPTVCAEGDTRDSRKRRERALAHRETAREGQRNVCAPYSTPLSLLRQSPGARALKRSIFTRVRALSLFLFLGVLFQTTPRGRLSGRLVSGERPTIARTPFARTGALARRAKAQAVSRY